MEESASCDGVRIGQLIHYQAELSISSCKLGYQQKRFKIKPQDLSDSMVVDVEINCDCDCHDKVCISVTSCYGYNIRNYKSSNKHYSTYV